MICISCFLLLLLTQALAISNRIDVTLPYTLSKPVIDGKISEGEWQLDGTVKLRADNTATWGGMDDAEHITPVDAYYMWDDDGIFVYADITDNDVSLGSKRDCFEFSFNPGELIPHDDPLEGMFFMCWPEESQDGVGGVVTVTRHNLDHASKNGFESDINASYTLTEKGWAMEAFIPWEYICPAERAVWGGRTWEQGVLKRFDPLSDGAYLTATVCYLNGREGDGNYSAVYRTATDNDASNFSTSSYNVYLTLGERVIPQTLPETDPTTQALPAASDPDTERNGGNNALSVIIAVVCIAVIIGSAAFVIIFLLKNRRERQKNINKR